MGRAPCCDKANVKKGPWSTEEDAKMKEYIEKNGTGGNWIALPQKAGLVRCGKSCRLRWLNYLRPNIKHGDFSEDEDRLICNLYVNIGSRWSIIAAQLPGRTDNDIKNYWNTKLKKKFIGMIPSSHMRRPQKAINHQLISPYQTSASPLSHLSPLPALSPSSSGYNFSNNSYYNSSSGTPASSFPGYYEAISIIPSTTVMNTTTCSSNASNTTFLQIPDSHVSNNGFLMFGRDASCSSSDGSYNNNHQANNIRLYPDGKFYGSEYMGFQGYSDCTRVDGNQKMTMAYNSGDVVNGFSEKANGFYGETPFDYSLEETRQLINSKFSDNLYFFADEISKTVEEKVMYYCR